MGKMTKIMLAAALLLCFAIPGAKAQNLYFGLKLGVSVPDLKSGGSSPVSSGYSSISGPYFGLFGDYGLSKHFSLQAELNYSAQGGEKSGVQAVPTAPFAPYFPPGTPVPEYFYATFKSKARLNYLELPVLAKYTISIGAAWKVQINAGPYIGYLLNAKTVSSDSSNIYFDEGETQPVPVGKQDFSSNMTITDDIHRINYGLQFGAGLQCFVSATRFIYLNVGGNFGLTNIQKYAEDGENRTGAATMVVGYAAKF